MMAPLQIPVKSVLLLAAVLTIFAPTVIGLYQDVPDLTRYFAANLFAGALLGGLYHLGDGLLRSKFSPLSNLVGPSNDALQRPEARDPIEDHTPWSTVQCTPTSVNGLGSAQGATLTVEAAKATKREIAFRLAVASSTTQEGWLRKAEGAYVTDATGTRYELSKERPGPGDPRVGSRSSSYSRKLMPTEVYRFELAFPPVSQPMPYIQLKHPDFAMLKVSLVPTAGQDERANV